MQRETALALFGIGLILLLLLMGAAFYIVSPSRPRPVSEGEKEPTAISPAPLAFPPTRTVSPMSPPTIVTPSLSPSPYTVTPKVVTPSERGAIVAPPVPLPPLALPQLPSSSQLPKAKPAPAIIPQAEVLRWAQALVANYRPRWHLELIKSVDPRLKGESYAVAVGPNNRVTIEARTNAGWLYGLLDLAERLQWGEVLPAQWRWSPPLSERGLVVENPEWLLKPPRSQEELENSLREQLRELAWWRFNTLVIKCHGNEANLNRVLSLLEQVAPEYGIEVVVWTKIISSAIQSWAQWGGQVATETPPQNSRINNHIIVATDPDLAASQIGRGSIVGLKFQLVAPSVSPIAFRFKHNRDRLLAVIGLDEAYREVFWFDPAWTHQLVRSIRDFGLKGFWLSVASVPHKWTVAAFAQAIKNPDADGEALWLRRWAKRGLQADRWLALFRGASRVIPEILWLGVSSQPQYGASLKSFFLARPIDSSWGFTVLSIPETLKLERKPEDMATLTADEIARRLEQRASLIWTLAARLPEPLTSDWRVAKRLALLNSWLGQFYASKIDAALAWGRFEGGDRLKAQECLMHLAKSVKAWEQVVAIANTVYSPRNRWALRLPEWRHEFEEYRALTVEALP